MRRDRWLLLVAAAGAALFALSFVNAWIVHDRELRGEGYRFVQVTLSAWRSAGMPVLTVGAAVAALVATWAAASAWVARLPRWPLLPGTVLVLAVVVSVAIPIGQRGQASDVDLSPGLLVVPGLVLASAMVIGAVQAVRPSRRALLGLGAIGIAILAASVGGRWAALQWGEGDNRFWEVGSYTLAPGDGGPVTMTLEEDAYRIGDTYAGSLEWTGWTVVLHDDPACPDARGTYHARSAGDSQSDIRFVKVVDTCADGDRAALLERGTWGRDP
jgi:hypothetical protein